nr:zinc finger protein 831 [Misgurnus anguillicaudatus]
MATSKQSFVRSTENPYPVSTQREEEMLVKAPLTTMYVHDGSAPGLQQYRQARPGALQDAVVVPLFVPRMCSNQPLPALTLHIASTTTLQQQRLGAPATSSRPKSIGKHVCPHCGKDCLKPSVLEKHLRCHTGERPYPCTTCGISFKTQSNLYKHKRTQAHARLFSESDKGTFSSQESTNISKDNCISSSSEMHGEDSVDMKNTDEVFPAVSVTTHCQVDRCTESGTEWPLHKTFIDGFSTTPTLHDKVVTSSKNVKLSSESKDSCAYKNRSTSGENERVPLTSNRTPLQRQEALFSKPWESPASRRKSQSHDSTDSGFSDSSEHHSFSSPGSSLHDPSMESLPETTMKHQELCASQAPLKMSLNDTKSKVSIQEKQKLEERISKLIHENSVLVEDKQLENVRPRKTVLSKQGSIDLPVPYTYKDSFHFEIRSSKHFTSSQKQDRGGGDIYSSMPTQDFTSLEHAPLTRSSSLPFTMGGKHSDGAINPNISRRCSAGHVNPFGSTDQQAPSHRSLVRQVAVDCLSSLNGSSVDRGSISSLSSDGDNTDIGTETTIKGNYRKKTQKFDYTKWHTYKGGTFRKLYNPDRDSPLKTKKTASSIEQTDSLEIQISQPRDSASVSPNFTSCSVVCNSQTAEMSLAQKLNQVTSSYILLKSPLRKTVEEPKQMLTLQNTQSSDFHIPSERKKQRTGSNVHMLTMTGPSIRPVNANLWGLISKPLPSTCGTHSSIKGPAHKVNKPNLHAQSSFIQFSKANKLLCKTPSPAFCLINMGGTSGTPSVSTNSPTLPEAKTSFPPKYQLKIPSSADGVLTSCSSLTLPEFSQSHPTTVQTVQCHTENENQGPSKVPPFEQTKQCKLCETTSILTDFSSLQNQTNTLSKVLPQLQPTTPTSVSLISAVVLPTVQHQQSSCTKDVVENQSTNPVSSSHPVKTSANILSFTSGSCSGSANTTVQIYPSTTMSSTIQNDHVSQVFTFEKPPGLTEDTQFTSSKMATGDFQSSHSEGKVTLWSGSTQSQAQNTFYVRTADLQIVMQLISDEQLALIEPHIEKIDFKPAESCSVTSICTNQISLSQEEYSNDVTTVGVTQDMVNLENKEQNAAFSNLKNAIHDSSANSNTCVSSWSHPQKKFHNSASTGQFNETDKIPKNFQDRKSVEFNVTTELHHSLSGDKLSELDLVDKRQDNKHHIFVRNLVNSFDTKVTFSQDQTDTKQELNIEKSVLKEMFCLKDSNHTQTIKNTDPEEVNKTRPLMPVTLLRDIEGVQLHSLTASQYGSCFADKMIPMTTPTESQQMQKVLISTTQPCQSKSCWAACSATKEMKTCSTSKLKLRAHQNETFLSDQTTTHYEIQKDFGQTRVDYTENVKAYTVTPNRTSNSITEDSSEFGSTPVHTHHDNLDIFTGPGEDGALKNVWFQRDSKTDSRESDPRKPESGVRDEEKPGPKMTDMNNTCKSCENNGKSKEESCEDHKTADQAHHHLSQEVINASLNISNPTHNENFSVPNNPETSVCNIFSQTCPSQGQEGFNNYARRDSEDKVFGKGTSQETSQSETTSPAYGIILPSPGLDIDRFSIQPCRHLLVPPLLVNGKQKEIQKETQTRNNMTLWTYGTQPQVISPQNKQNSATVSGSVWQNHGSALVTEVVRTSTTPSSCAALMSFNSPHKTYNQISHTNQTGSLQVINSQTNFKLNYSGNSSYLEHEDSNSSSDDEQKLVIELE